MSDLTMLQRLAERAVPPRSRAGRSKKWDKVAWFKSGVFRVTVRTMSVP